MDNKKDYYKILNVNIFANEEKIKKSYRALVMKYHPDRNPGDKDAEEKFKEVTEAYEILSNRESRTKYNILYFANNKALLVTVATFGVFVSVMLTKKNKK